VSIAGEFVTETFEYDGGRQVTVYVPPSTPEAVVFAGDGQLIAQWGAILEAAADLPPTMIVGVHRSSDETLRLHEYSPGFDPERFVAHEKFFVDDVRRWASARFALALPTARTAVFGVGYQPSGVLPSSLPRAYFVAGTLEPFFRENTTRWARALRDAGADVVVTERVGSHGGLFWQEELPLMVGWAFEQ